MKKKKLKKTWHKMIEAAWSFAFESERYGIPPDRVLATLIMSYLTAREDLTPKSRRDLVVKASNMALRNVDNILEKIDKL